MCSLASGTVGGFQGLQAQGTRCVLLLQNSVSCDLLLQNSVSCVVVTEFCKLCFVVAGFCKEIPGLKQLCQEDQSLLMRSGYFDMWVVSVIHHSSHLLRVHSRLQFIRP